ncbi:hypothetical protein TrRE_jg13171 [Triparma retinervis]|uniref:Pyruvate kinase n=1 Tax=Triparma retinervis TaxID=2557542 RepID=A0A9W7DMM5_9STRA|nr:hypothetical protein TrRE_jg13171 [Triparma retinervis]
MPVLKRLVSEGVRVMRLNFSHATVEEADLRMTNLRASSGRNGDTSGMGADDDVLRRGCVGVVGSGRNMRASLLDTRGPEIRTLKVENDTSGKETLTLTKGEEVGVESDVTGKMECKKGKFYVNYAGIEKVVKPGDRVLLDDGAVTLKCTSVSGPTVLTTVLNTGDVRSRVGVNLPGVKTGLPAMSEKDRVDVKYGIENDVDYVAASFVRDAEGVREIRGYIDSIRGDGVGPLIISKIENVEGLENFEEILSESDGIMVARGDLGVEIPLERVTLEQKNMVRRCNEVGKPVIVATQMLESMTKSPRPTRAEVSDVTNAVLDGADAVMLSGETAKGNYVVETVNAMQSIIKETEGWVKEGGVSTSAYVHPDAQLDCEYNSVAKAAVAAAEASDAKAIIVLTKTGRTARLISRYRPNVPIVCFANSYKVGRQLQLYRACHPVVGLGNLDPKERGEEAAGMTKELGFVQKDDTYVLIQAEKGTSGKNVIGMKIGTVE